MSRDVALRRRPSVLVATHVMPRLDWLDRALGFWCRLSPVAQFAAVPMAILIQRTVFPRHKFLGSLLRWGSAVFGVMHGVSSIVRRD